MVQVKMIPSGPPSTAIQVLGQHELLVEVQSKDHVE